MTGGRYPRRLVESLLVKGAFPESYRIMSWRQVGSPLGTRPVDSRFVSRSGGYTVLYAAAEFATAFIETVVRDRLARRRTRQVALREITERVWVRIAGRPGAVLTLLDLRGRIAEDGNHAELMARPGGLYRRLFDMQSPGFVDSAAAATA